MQVALSLLVAIGIFWLLYKDIQLSKVKEALSQTSLGWVFLSLVLSVVGYWVRAWRWKILIVAEEGLKPLSTSNTFWALMVGYLTNLLIPRAGELSRCAVLSKTDGLPMGRLLGTVFLERVIDLLLMIAITLLAFLIEGSMFLKLTTDLMDMQGLVEKLKGYFLLLLFGLLILSVISYFILAKYKESGFFKKVRHFTRDFIQGLISLKQVKNQATFWLSSIGIWLIYYFSLVFLVWAIPSSDTLSLQAVLMVLVMGSIGMIAPVQGGIGTFHALVAFILMTYGLTEEEGKIFAVIVHGLQLILMMILGLIGLGLLWKGKNMNLNFK